jgi:hypothetical protein
MSRDVSDASEPAKLLFEHGYFHLARLADLIARAYPRRR